MLNEQQIRSILETIPDPEIPVISVVELGVIREIQIDESGRVTISMTPTYSGCPAMDQMEKDVKKNIEQAGVKEVTIQRVYQPAWTTDWLSKEAREKLREYGIAPPLEGKSKQDWLDHGDGVVKCPHCGSLNTMMISLFGSTACKSLHRCSDCLEPFDHFKCL